MDQTACVNYTGLHRAAFGWILHVYDAAADRRPTCEPLTAPGNLRTSQTYSEEEEERGRIRVIVDRSTERTNE